MAKSYSSDDRLWTRAFKVAVRYGKHEAGYDTLTIRDERLFAEAYSRGFKAGVRSHQRKIRRGEAWLEDHELDKG